MSKHGGSPDSGLVLPIGLEALKPATPEGMVLVPQEVLDAQKQAAERKERALQLARRGLADGYLKASIQTDPDPIVYGPTDFGPEEQKGFDAANAKRVFTRVDMALSYADALIKQTGGGI